MPPGSARFNQQGRTLTRCVRFPGRAAMADVGTVGGVYSMIEGCIRRQSEKCTMCVIVHRRGMATVYLHLRKRGFLAISIPRAASQKVTGCKCTELYSSRPFRGRFNRTTPAQMYSVRFSSAAEPKNAMLCSRAATRRCQQILGFSREPLPGSRRSLVRRRRDAAES